MKLYSGPLSLFAKKVEVALAEKSLSFERELVRFTQQHGYFPKHPDVLAANPKGQIPVLIDGAVTLYDSTVIFEYLEDAYPDPPLYPSQSGTRARCRLLDVFADEIMLVPLRALMHRTEPAADQNDRWPANEARAREAETALANNFAHLDGALGERDYFCDAFSIADISLFMGVFFAQRLGGPSLGATPSLSAWYRRTKSRPAFARMVEETIAADRDLSAPVTGAFKDDV